VSAIFGVYGLNGQPVAPGLAAMHRCLGHRGPDGSGLWQQEMVGIGHQLMRTGTSSGRLPLVDDERFAITADARIDNRHDLIGVLGLAAGADSLHDADVILAAYQRWGDRTPEHLIGDFAFAIWDRTRQTLFCARDQVGIRPFYYCHDRDRRFVFASEIKAILAHPEVPRRISERKIADHLTRRFADVQSTFYEDIRRLPPAHSLTVRRGAIELRRYWSLDCARELRLANADEYAEAFREIFVDAVRSRTRNVVAVGSTLSGGLDSSSIACAADLLLSDQQRPLRTFSAIFPSLSEPELRRIDERRYVDAVLRDHRFDQTYVCADQSSPLADWSRISSHLGDACLAPNLYIHWGLYRAAAAKNVRVLLDGLDGDTTVSHGLGYLTDLARAGRLLRFSDEAAALARNNPAAFPFRRVAWQLGLRPLVPQAVMRTWRALRSTAAEPTVVSPYLLDQVSSAAAAAEFDDDGRQASARESHGRSLNSPLIPYAMEFADAASSAFCVEVRYPFFDRRLIEFCLAVPAEQKLQNGWTRSIMRRAMTGIIPTEIQWRTTKADLSPNFSRGLFERDRKTIEDVVFSGLESVEAYVDVSAVQEAYRRWVVQPYRHQRDALTLFTVTTLALWLENSKSPPLAATPAPRTKVS
jgi:asparagine synthase (glutamine-hydrolysing)